MTTPRDLLIVTMDRESIQSVERGDLSLALAGAEVIDLVDAQAVALERDRMVPAPQPPVLADRLLDEAAASLVRGAPYESVGDWLWRRGRGLPEVYLADMEAEGQVSRERHRRWLVFPTSELVLADTPERHRAAERWTSGEPVLGALGAAVGIGDKRVDDVTELADDTTATVLVAVDDALRELAAERLRRGRRRDDAAADTVRRGY